MSNLTARRLLPVAQGQSARLSYLTLLFCENRIKRNCYEFLATLTLIFTLQFER